MRDPKSFTPNVFDYLWLYWIFKQKQIPKDIIYIIIGKRENVNYRFHHDLHGIILKTTDTYHKKIRKDEIHQYNLWLNRVEQ